MSITERVSNRAFLYSLIASIVIGATLTVILLLRGEWGELELRALGTTLTVALTSVGGLACSAARMPQRRNRLPNTGLVLCLVAGSAVLIGIWMNDLLFKVLSDDYYWKVTLTVICFAVATVHICLLSIAKLAPRFHIVYLVTAQVILLLALFVTALIFAEELPFDMDQLVRLTAVLAVITAGLTLAIPILHRISRMESQDESFVSPLETRSLESIDTEIARLQAEIVRLQKLRERIVGQ